VEQVERDVDHNPGRNSREYRVVVYAYPIVAARRRTEVIDGGVGDYIRRRAVFCREPVTTVPVMRVIPMGPYIPARHHEPGGRVAMVLDHVMMFVMMLMVIALWGIGQRQGPHGQ
jgi:hypothetical protein